MAYTYSKIATYTVGSGGISSIDFLNIPQIYTDLVIAMSLRSTAANNSISLQFNGIGVNNSRSVEGNGSTASSSSRSDFYLTAIVSESGYTASTFSNVNLYIPNYTSSNNKSFSIDGVTENNATLSYATLIAGLWSNTAAINSITFTPGGGNFAQHTTAHLYGIKAEL